MATRPVPLSYIWASATQGSNDAFVQANIQTGLTGLVRQAYRIRELLFELSGGGTLNASYQFSLTRKSFAAIPTLGDKSLIVKRAFSNVMTTSGAIQAQQVWREKYDEQDNLLLVEDPVYLQLDSASTSTTNTIYVRIGYEVIAMNEVDRLNLVATSLAD